MRRNEDWKIKILERYNKIKKYEFIKVVNEYIHDDFLNQQPIISLWGVVGAWGVEWYDSIYRTTTTNISKLNGLAFECF